MPARYANVIPLEVVRHDLREIPTSR